MRVFERESGDDMYLGENIPKLGFGLMRLPYLDTEDKKTIDINQVKKMVDAFMDAGFTYFDTAYGYDEGRSEAAAKEAIVDRYPRESFQLATKLPAWAAKSPEEARAMLDTSLERTGVDYFDYYLLHNLGGHRTQVFEDYGLWEFVQEKKAAGVLKNVGFSLHDKAEALDELLHAHSEIDFVQLQLNYADWENPVIESRKCYEVALEHNIPLIVMEPLKGGSLARLPEQVTRVFEEAGEASLPSWGLRFAASLDNIITVLSGMSDMAQAEENIAIMKDFKPLDADEKAVIVMAREELERIPNIPCTSCKYCIKDCPQEINIPAALNAVNLFLVYGDLYRAKETYTWNVRHHPASTCIQCGVCEGVCPQSIPIIDELERAAELLE